MSETINAIYEDGIFRPLQDVKLRDRQRVRLEIIPEDEVTLLKSQKKALVELAGIGSSGLTDVAREHDRYIYQKES
jgi:predicted DNA-binding antitoxin AbrB/MazE fold protein